MKTIKLLTITILISLLFSSCTKQSVTIGNYTNVNPPSQNNQTNYINGGNVPTSTVTSSNVAVGTNWVISYLKVGFTTMSVPLDTIRFVDNQYYTINNGAVKPYQLTNGALSSYNLVLNFFYPFGSGNYSGEVSLTFVTDGVINFCQFTNINSTQQTVIASFIKI